MNKQFFVRKRCLILCFQIGHAAGWIIPMAWLISQERVRDYGCNSIRAAAEYFRYIMTDKCSFGLM